MIMGYYRLGKHDDARQSMKKILDYARSFRMDNPLVEFGNAVYQPKEPINCCYDTWGVPAAMIRGLFEYLYRADGLTIMPHIPPGLIRLEQHFPVRFGRKRLYLATSGQGPVTEVFVNGQPWKLFDVRSVSLPFDQTPDEAVVQIVLGGAKATMFQPHKSEPLMIASPPSTDGLSESRESEAVVALAKRVAAVRDFHKRLVNAGLADSYEAAHARLVADYLATTVARLKMVADGKLPRLPPASQAAADRSYVRTTTRLYQGLEKTVQSYKESEEPKKRQIERLWNP